MFRMLALTGCLFATLLGATSGLRADEVGERIAGPVAATILKVRDGDTVEVEAFIWPQQVVRVAVRLRGIDAPELKAKCEGEKTAALAARDRLIELVAGGDVALSDVAGDKYFGRVLARLSAGAESDLSKRLLEEGLVAPYDGGRRRDWCEGTLSSLSSVLPG
ncbi:nuclease [Aureimonas sp. Leaf454]|uniref:thermonuclease family protein n=1 Tax=Aureimonas sp. Leaf454 TaxID=1736381 RepID=UPI0006FEE7CD|nr:thermonuclease family protein [Aureimonas sp. Leaf454]KQT42906.1 nuclease [Aureimonas sp. Leaf454]